LFNPTYNTPGTFPYTPITESRVAYMDGVLNGTITKGNFWGGFYLGDVTVFTGTYDGNGNENAQLERANDHLTQQPRPIPGVITVEDYADHYNYVLLAPNGWTRNPQWGWGPGEQSLLAAFSAVTETYNIDPTKVFVTGNSLGGAGTLNFATRHTEMFRAMAPTAPAAPNPLTGKVVDLPTHFLCNNTDVTVPYAYPPTGAAPGNCVPDFDANVKNVLRNVTFQTIEEGNHSYGFASAEQVIFEFFDSVLAPLPDNDVQAVHFTVGSTTAVVTDSRNYTSQVTLAAAPFDQDRRIMVGMADLAKIYGPNFRVYEIHAYNTNPANRADVVATKFNNLMVNVKKGNTFLRVGGKIHVGDTYSGSGAVPASDPHVDSSTLSVPTVDSGADLFVPVVQFMNLFGKTIS
jgi:pimeloyl-ACP methyl ester carboxylesterase